MQGAWAWSEVASTEHDHTAGHKQSHSHASLLRSVLCQSLPVVLVTHMIRIERAPPQTRALCQPPSSAFGLLLRNLQALLAGQRA